jgi:hypothetical protein
MNKLEQIEKSVSELNSKEFEVFSAWFEAFQAERWDRQIEADVKSGKLDNRSCPAAWCKSTVAKPLASAL